MFTYKFDKFTKQNQSIGMIFEGEQRKSQQLCS